MADVPRNLPPVVLPRYLELVLSMAADAEIGNPRSIMFGWEIQPPTHSFAIARRALHYLAAEMSYEDMAAEVKEAVKQYEKFSKTVAA